MPLSPYFYDEITRPRLDDVYDRYWGAMDDPYSEARYLMPSLRSGYSRPWRNLVPRERGAINLRVDKGGFKVSLDVQQFRPEDLNVKVVDNYLVVEGKHEERGDEHGLVSRQFTRRYKIPEEVDVDKLTSELTSDGVLMLCAPTKSLPDEKGKSIPITQTNTPVSKEAAPDKV